MEIHGPRVRCANCGTIYDKPPSEKVFWIGVPFTITGMEVCPKCGSNASDLVSEVIESTNHSYHIRYGGGSNYPKPEPEPPKRIPKPGNLKKR